MRKRVLFMICTVVMVLQLTGCGSKWNDKYAQKYTQAVLEILCTGTDSTDVKPEDISEDDYDSFRQKYIDENIELLVSDLGDSPDGTNQIYKDFMEKALKTASYEVGEATSADGTYAIPVTIHPIMYSNSTDEDAIKEQLNQLYADGKITEENVSAYAIQLALQQDIDAMDDPVYGDDYEMDFVITTKDDVHSVLPESCDEFVLAVANIEQVTPDDFDADDELSTKLAVENETRAELSVLCTGQNATAHEIPGLSEDQYQECNQELLDSLFTQMDVDHFPGSAEVVNGYKEFFVNAYKNASYEVGAAEVDLDNGTATVPVTIHPIDIAGAFDQNLYNQKTAAVANDPNSTSEDLTDAMVAFIVEQYNAALSNPTYGSDVVINVELKADDNGNYYISDDSINEFVNNVLII